MKKLLLFLKLFLFTLCSAQFIEVSPYEWNSTIDTSAFDGIKRDAFIVGTSDYVSNPVLIVNRIGDSFIRVYITSLESVNGDATVYIKFDSEDTIYELSAIYTFLYTFIPGNGYVIRFHSQLLSIENFINKLKTKNTLYIRLANQHFFIDQIDFTLNGADEALEILEK